MSTLLAGTGSFVQLAATAATASSLFAGTGAFSTLLAGTGSLVSLSAGTSTFSTLFAATGSVSTLLAGTGTFTSLLAGTGTFVQLSASTGTFVQLAATAASVSSLAAATGSFSTLLAGTGTFLGPLGAHGLSTAGFTTTTAQLGVYAGGSGAAPAASTAFVQGAAASSASGLALQLQPSGGALYSARSILDDGFGNTTLASTNGGSTASAPLFVQYGALAAGSNLYIELGKAQTSNQAAAFGFSNTATPALNTATMSVFGGPLLSINGNGLVSTPHNTLDDGGGSITALGTLTLGNGTTQRVSQLSLYGSIVAATGYFCGLGVSSGQTQYNSQNTHIFYSPDQPLRAARRALLPGRSGQHHHRGLRHRAGRLLPGVAQPGQHVHHHPVHAGRHHREQRLHAGVHLDSGATMPLYLQPSGGVLRSANNVLDDGAGNVSAAGTLSLGTNNVASAVALSLYGSTANATGYFYGLGCASGTASGALQYYSQLQHNWYSQTTATGTTVNTMNLGATGTLGLLGTLVMRNTNNITTQVGTFTFPSSPGTLALASFTPSYVVATSSTVSGSQFTTWTLRNSTSDWSVSGVQFTTTLSSTATWLFTCYASATVGQQLLCEVSIVNSASSGSSQPGYTFQGSTSSPQTISMIAGFSGSLGGGTLSVSIVSNITTASALFTGQRIA